MKRRRDTLVYPDADTVPETEQRCYPVGLSGARNATTDESVERVEFEVVSFDPSGLGPQLLVREDEARSWETDMFPDEAEVDLVDEWIEQYEAELVAQSHDFLEAHCAEKDLALGRVSRAYYRERIEAMMRWARAAYVPARGEFRAFADALGRLEWGRYLRQYSIKRLREEKQDEEERKHAAEDSSALAAYLQKVKRSTAKWLAWRTHRPLRETLESDIVADCVSATLAAFREGDWWTFERAGRAAFWKVRDSVIATHRRRRRLWVVDTPLERVRPPTPRPDELLEREQLKQQWRDSIAGGLRPRLSRFQRRYLDAIIVEVQLGGLYGLATRVAQRTRRNKAQVSRAIQRIRSVAEQLGASDLFELAAAELCNLDGAS